MDAVTFENYDDVVGSDLQRTVLHSVIARDGQSKRPTDLLPLDGGTVGIAHFAVGGLAELYRQMDTQKFFQKSREEMIEKFSSACRPNGKTGNDTGWGCFTQDWWRDGMKAFLDSEGSLAIQESSWASMMKPVIERALSEGWRDRRSLAIALGVANSMGKGGFANLAEQEQWDAEAVLKAYAGTSEHRKRRQEAIDKHFPKPT